jgi:hypothetical protein
MNPITDQVEVNLLGIEDGIHPLTFHRMWNKMLLYDVSRPFDRNESRANLFPTDLSDYIGLSTPLDCPKIRQKSHNTGLTIYICDDKLINLRMELVKNGMATAERMLTYFRVCPDVTMWQYPRRNTFETSFQLGQSILANNCFESLQATICLKLVLTYTLDKLLQIIPLVVLSFVVAAFVLCTAAWHSRELKWSNPCTLAR